MVKSAEKCALAFDFVRDGLFFMFFQRLMKCNIFKSAFIALEFSAIWKQFFKLIENVLQNIFIFFCDRFATGPTDKFIPIDHSCF